MTCSRNAGPALASLARSELSPAAEPRPTSWCCPLLRLTNGQGTGLAAYPRSLQCRMARPHLVVAPAQPMLEHQGERIENNEGGLFE